MAFPSPSLTAPSLSAWQFSLSGLTFGAGTPIQIQTVEGLGGLATVRSADQPRSRDHGELIGLDVYGGRDVTIDLDIVAGTSTLAANMAALSAVTEVGLATEQPLWFQIPNMPTLCVMCRPRQRTVKWDVAYSVGAMASLSCQFHATDPRIYTAGADVTVGLGSPTSGMSFPAGFPIVFGATTPNSVTVTNAGNTEMRPQLVISGPCTNPSIGNSSIAGNPTLTFSNPSQTSYTVLAGDQLVVDLDLHSILYYSGGVSSGSPGASRAAWLKYGSTWWDLVPGSNVVQFNSADSVSVAGTCQINYASAYML